MQILLTVRNLGRKHLVLVLLQDQTRQHIDVRLWWITLQHQRHHTVLIGKDLAELLSEAGCFLHTPVGAWSSTLPLLLPVFSMSFPFPLSPFTCRFRRSTQRSGTKVQDLCLRAWSFGGGESGGRASKRVVSWVRIPERVLRGESAMFSYRFWNHSVSTCVSCCYLWSERRKSSRWGPPLPRGSSGTMKWSPTNVYWRRLQRSRNCN